MTAGTRIRNHVHDDLYTSEVAAAVVARLPAFFITRLTIPPRGGRRSCSLRQWYVDCLFIEDQKPVYVHSDVEGKEYALTTELG